jgi:hypothetical protein
MPCFKEGLMRRARLFSAIFVLELVFGIGIDARAKNQGKAELF